MKVIYTALFSNYEELKEPTVITPGWQYICYTDQPLTSKVWKIIPTILHDTPLRMARYYKVMEWVDWEQSIWIDASFRIDTNLNDWWSKYFKGGITAPKHPLRDCVYEEILACIIGNRGDKEQLQKQDKEYKLQHIPPHGGIITSGLLMRQSDTDTIELCEKWWAEIVQHSTRDQVALAKAGIGKNINTYLWDYRNGKDFIYHHHFYKR
jgi:hypothetical protein